MATEKRARSRSRENGGGGSGRARSRSRSPTRRRDDRRRAKRRHRRPHDHRHSHSQRHSESHSHSHSRSRGKKKSRSPSSTRRYRSRSGSRSSSNSRRTMSRSTSHRRRDVSSSEERRPRAKGREQQQRRSRDLDERHEHEREHEREPERESVVTPEKVHASVTPEKARESVMPEKAREKPAAEERKETPDPVEIREDKEQVRVRNVGDANENKETANAKERAEVGVQEEPEDEDKKQKDKEASFRFEHLEAIRNVQLITRNEYPLSHLKRENLLNRDYDDNDDEDDDDAVCYCNYPDTFDKDKKRCDDVSCLNFATYVECNSNCPAREYCGNQRLQHQHLFPKLEAFKTEHKGFGVRTTEEIAQSRIIGEYVGEIIDQKELNLRLKSAPRNELNFYYLLLEPGIYIDARNKGSFTRFVNHSCEPNCKTEKWTVKGETRIAVIALRDINKGEELTFDYQWKSLGSRQIKCFCESANCKGIIGTEGDVVKDDTPRGYFREPTKSEIGTAIVNRRIRIFKSPDDHSMYYIATVRSYDEKDGLYEVDYQDTIDVADEEDVFDSPDDKSSERYIRLSELDWHIFFELDGLSEDQIEKEVFSIPKRRVTDQQQGESREPSPKQNESGVKSSRSSREPSPSNAMFTGRTISNAIPATKRNNDGETVDEDGNVITNKILVKGVSNKCSAASLRTLFLVDDRRHRSGASDGAAARRNSQDVVNDLELFFFNDDSGWALVEFSDSKYTSMFQRKLNNRPLYGKSLRIYHAGKKEMENFHRAKRNVAVRRRQDQAKSSTAAGAKDSTERQSGDSQKTAVNDAPKVILPYCFGRKLNWQVSVEQMEDSPSRRIGISPSLEQKMREKCAKLIFRLVKKLHLDREDATSAIIALNRYLTFHAMDVSKVEHLAASLLHMFLKAHSRRFSWESFVSEVYAAKNSASSSNDPTKQLHTKSDEFLVTERPLLAVEKELLEGLRYDLSSEDPYALLDSLTSGNKGRKKPQQHGDSKNSLVFPSDVQKEAKHLVAEALRLPIWVQTPVECIVLSIMYVSAAVTQALKERASNSSKNSAADASSSLPDFLPVLDGKKNELESLMLLECSLLICDNLKERWNRLEKIAKPSRKVDRSEDYFDTEQFAVAKEKPVEISLRISTLLKSWISVPSSSSGRASISPDRDPSSGQRDDKTDFITLSMIGKSLAATAISNGSDMKSASESKRSTQGRDDDESEIVSAAAVVPKKVAKGPKGGSTSVLSSSDRLHTTEITDAEMIRKRCYLGTISKDAPFDLAEKKVYLQAWPNRDSESPFSKKGDISKSCVRELSAAIILHSKSPNNFIKLHGIVFPEEKKIKRSSISSASESESKGDATTVDLDAEMMDFSDTSVFSSSASTRLETSKHYLAFEQPLHMYSGIFEAKVVVPTNLKKKAIFDMLQSLAVCHEFNFVHRFVAPSHLYLFKSGAKLGGYHTMRKTTPGSSSSSNVYEMSENERKELCLGSWLSVTAPELLLGDRSFSWRSDIWSAGCVALSVLLDNTAFLQGMDTRMQLDLIFRLCGTPHAVWQGATKLPLFGRYKPKDEYKMRLRKTVTEHLQKQKREGLPDEAYDLLESMLHLDPAKRLSAKKLLEMDFFADIRSSSDAFDFSKVPETYSTQKKKLLAHLKSSKPKRRRPASGSGDFSSSALTSSSSHRSSSYYQRKLSEGGDSSGKRESVSRSKQNSTTTSGDRTIEMAEDVPLPAFFNASSSDATAKSESSLPTRPEKRAKLGWGMGLHSTEKAE